MSPCLNGGICIDSEPTFKCICHAEYYGTFCEKRVNPCIFNSPCKNGGTCIFTKNETVTCSCTESFTGEFCDSSEKIIKKEEDKLFKFYNLFILKKVFVMF